MTDNHNRGYQGPAFNRSGRRRPSAIPDDELAAVEGGLITNRSNISTITEHSNHGGRRSSHLNTNAHIISNESAISRRSGAGDCRNSIRSGGYRTQGEHGEVIAPLHDPAGKPLRRHGTETIGDLLLHPLKELKMHQKRTEAYEAERNSWNEKHPESIASRKDIDHITDVPVENVKTRLVVHFRRRIGDQDFNLTDEKIDLLEKPLQLTHEEKEELRLVEDADDFIDFLENTKRMYSVKAHKTAKFRADTPSSKSDESEGSKQSLDLGDKSNATSGIVTHSQTPSRQNTGSQIIPRSDSGNSEATYPHTNRSPDDLLIDLNENVYLQVQFIAQEHHHHKVQKPIFSIPDPDLSDEIGQESSATWTELLGDVFYVGWLSQFTHSVHIDSMANVNIYAAWFVVMWWTWCSSALYSSRYDSGDVAHHIYKIIELCGLIIMAGSSDKEKFEKSPKYFIIGYIVMKAVLLVQYSAIFAVSLKRVFKSSRQPLGIYVAASAISIVMWGISLLYTSEEDMAKRYALWYTSIGMELLVHVRLQGNSRVSLAASHLGERFGLFTLIILGENCMGFIKMVAEASATPSVIACNVFGVTIIFCYFFMYFDDFAGEYMSHTRLSQLWMYLHFPLHIFQVAFGIALTDVITNHSEKKDTAANLQLALQSCAAAATAAEGHPTSTVNHAGNNTLAESAHFAIVSAAAAAAESSEGGHGLNCDDPLFSIKIFWITAGLILCINAFIKLINTPVNKASIKAHIICGSRIINAVVFFALSTTTYAHMDGLEMVSVMMACLLLQSAVDLLD